VQKIIKGESSMNIPSSDVTHDPIPTFGFPGPAETGIEDLVVNSVLWIKLGVEAIGVLVMGVIQSDASRIIRHDVLI
jgi:hypothetical protein